MCDERRVGELVRRWRAGESEAANELYARYSRRLLKLARRLMDVRLRRRVDADDVIQSVFRTFFRRTAEGEYPIDDSVSLWRLLVQITANKVRKQAEWHRAAKRDVGAEWDVSSESEVLPPEALAHDPSPEEASALIDELERIFSGLKDPEPEIVRLCLHGHSSSEIAAAVHRSRWTVRRVLARVGAQLQRRLREDSGE